MEKPYVITLWYFLFSISLSLSVYILYRYYKFKWSNPLSTSIPNISDLSSGINSDSVVATLTETVAGPVNDPEDLPNVQLDTRQRYILKTLLITCLTFLWYSISISFTVYNKWILRTFGGGFNYPITTTLVHMVVKFVFSSIWIYFFYHDKFKPIPNEVFYKIVCPIGLTTGLDIALSNEAVSYLTISIATIIKTTVVMWTFAWGIIFGLERFSYQKFLAIVCIICGLSLCVLSDIGVSVFGVTAGLLASMFGGLRWVFVQMLMEKDELSKVPIIALYRFSLVSVLSLLPLSFIFDFASITDSQFGTDITLMIEVVELLFFGGIISCFLIIVEINLIVLTSSLTLSILGEMKEIVQIVVAMIAFHDHFTWETGLGIATTLSGAEIYRRVKHLEKHAARGNPIETAHDGDGHDSEDSCLIGNNSNRGPDLGDNKIDNNDTFEPKQVSPKNNQPYLRISGSLSRDENDEDVIVDFQANPVHSQKFSI